MTTESLLYWIFGLALGGTLAGVVGKSLIADHGMRKVLPGLCVTAVALGLLLGWAINAYVAYARASATLF